MITFGHIVGAIILFVAYVILNSKGVVFVTYTFTGKGWGILKFFAYLIRLALVVCMVLMIHPHFILFSEFIQNITLDNMKTIEYFPFVNQLCWIMAIYMGTCHTEFLISKHIIMRIARNRMESERWTNL